MYRAAIPAGPSRSWDKRICEHSERRDARGPPDVCLRDCHKRLQMLESQGKDLRRTGQAQSYGGLRERYVVELGRRKSSTSPPVARSGSMRRSNSRISGAGSFGVNGATVRQKKPTGADFVSPISS